MNPDRETIAAYESRAGAYADRFATDTPDIYLKAFAARLPQRALVLDCGCGPGHASAYLRTLGHKTDAIDASPAMVALANQRYSIGARLAAFGDIAAEAAYDGVWANFSLLHASRAALPHHLARLHHAMKPGGLLHIGMKTGTGEGRDRFSRFYAYYPSEELLALLATAGFTVRQIWQGSGAGLAGTKDNFIVVHADA